MLESNYDIDMLEQGSYPFMLKQRIVVPRDILSNAMAAELIAKYATPKLKRLFLCHLSAHNNTAQLAEEAVKPCIPANTILMVLPEVNSNSFNGIVVNPKRHKENRVLYNTFYYFVL